MLVSPDKQSHAILLVSDNFDDIRGHQHPRNIQLEDRFGSGDRLDPRVHVHDQGNRFIREGILLKCSTVVVIEYRACENRKISIFRQQLYKFEMFFIGRVRDRHISVHRFDHILLSRRHSDRDVRRAASPFHPKGIRFLNWSRTRSFSPSFLFEKEDHSFFFFFFVQVVEVDRSSGMAGSGHADILFPWFGVWRFNSLLLLQSCEQQLLSRRDNGQFNELFHFHVCRDCCVFYYW